MTGRRASETTPPSTVIHKALSLISFYIIDIIPSTFSRSSRHFFQMPNLSFDIFFNEDVVNITASRSKGAPRVKPEWKVRTAPKLPPKTPPQAPTSVFGKPQQKALPSSEAKPQATFADNSSKPKRAPKKLEVRSKAQDTDGSK